MKKIIVARIWDLSDSKVSDIKIDSLFEKDLKFDNLNLVELCFYLCADFKTILFNYKILKNNDMGNNRFKTKLQLQL